MGDKILKFVKPLQISGSYTEYWALRWQRHSETTAIKILCSKRAACLIFPMFKCSQMSRCSNAVKNALSRSFCTSMYASQIWWYFRKSCMQRLCVTYNLDAELYTTCPGERVLAVITHQVQCSIPTFEALLRKNTCLFLERCRRSNNV